MLQKKKISTLIVRNKYHYNNLKMRQGDCEGTVRSSSQAITKSFKNNYTAIHVLLLVKKISKTFDN